MTVMDGAFRTRTEQLCKVGVQLTVEPRMLREPDATDLVAHQLREALWQAMERVGRLPVEDVRVQVDRDDMRDQLIYRALVMTRENHTGEWASVWAAYHEDQAWLANPINEED